MELTLSSHLPRSRSLPDFVLVDVLRLLARYQPTSDEERLTLMNRLDWTLASPAPHLVQVRTGCYRPLTGVDELAISGV